MLSLLSFPASTIRNTKTENCNWDNLVKVVLPFIILSSLSLPYCSFFIVLTSHHTMQSLVPPAHYGIQRRKSAIGTFLLKLYHPLLSYPHCPVLNVLSSHRTIACPAGTLWNTKTEQCNWAGGVDCGSKWKPEFSEYHSHFSVSSSVCKSVSLSVCPFVGPNGLVSSS